MKTNESMKVFGNLKTGYRLLYREYELFSEWKWKIHLSNNQKSQINTKNFLQNGWHIFDTWYN